MNNNIWPCVKCDMSFPTMDALERHKPLHEIRVTKAADVVNPQQQIQPKPKVIQPVVLRYKFFGNCEKCRTTVDTLEVEVQKKLNVIAWCNVCKEQKDTRVVNKI